jgi:hypothetical protein
MSAVTQIHAERETLAVEVNIPGHEARVATSLFERTKKQLLVREQGRCYICGATAETSGHPIESHHHPIERSLANMIDWARVQRDCTAGMWGPHAQSFDWSTFDPADPMRFVDDQTVNGVLLCKAHHTGKDEGIHAMPYPLWLAQKYGRDGYQFTPSEIIHHEG